MSNVKYMAFPIEFLKDAFTDISGVCFKGLRYACYVKYSEIEDIEELGSFFGFTLTPYTLDYGKKLFEMYGKNHPMVSVNVEILFDFAKNPKTEFEILVFLAYCGIKSIIGKKQYTKTNNGLLLARMFGYNEEKYLDRSNPIFQRYFSTENKIEYRLTEKIIKKELVLNWNLKYFGGKKDVITFRGFYVSFSKKVLLSELKREAIKHSENYKLIVQKKAEDTALAEALKELNLTPTDLKTVKKVCRNIADLK